MKNLKVVFMGTPTFAVSILEKLIEHTDVILVVSQPDAIVGRKRVLTPSPVKSYALEHGIDVFTPEKIRDDYSKIVELNPDIIVTCAYGQILPKDLLNVPKYKSINVHASLLPKLRGGAPIHRAIMNGFKKTGITIMYMDEKMDSGDIISQRETTITDADTLDILSDRLSKIGAELLIETLPCIIDGTNQRIKQDSREVTYGYIITKEDELIDFNRTACEVYDKIRGLSSNPGAYFFLNGEVCKVYEARIGDFKGEISSINNIYKDGIGIGCIDGEIIITKIKPAGKNIIDVKSYLNGIKKDKLIGVSVNAGVHK